MEVGFKEKEIDFRVPITGDIRKTRSELTYYSEIKKCLILVPIDFLTDLGSIPLFLQNCCDLFHKLILVEDKYSIQTINNNIIEEDEKYHYIPL